MGEDACPKEVSSGRVFLSPPMPPTFINPFADAIEPRFRTQPVPDFRPQTPLRTSRRKRFTEAIISGFQITSDADRERASTEAAREAENIRSRAAPKTLLKNQRIKECWIDYIHVFRLENQPRLRDDEVWQPELVETQMFGFLTTMASFFLFFTIPSSHIRRSNIRLPARDSIHSMPLPS